MKKLASYSEIAIIIKQNQNSDIQLFSVEHRHFKMVQMDTTNHRNRKSDKKRNITRQHALLKKIKV